MSEPGERSSLPWVMAALVLVIGGAKLEAARPIVARGLALAIPIVPVVLGVKRVEGGAESLERLASVVGWVAILASELCVLAGFFHVGAVAGLAVGARLALYAALAGALAAHLLEAKSQGRARFAGYVGITAGFGWFLSTHLDRDPFAAVFGAFFVSVLIGGGALLVGELLARLFARA